MKIQTLYILTTCLLLSTAALGQGVDKSYTEMIEEAFSLFQSEDFLTAAETYQAAFDKHAEEAKSLDVYNAACAYSLANESDNSFELLFQLANEFKYSNYWHVGSDLDLKALHDKEEWDELMAIMQDNKNEAEGVERSELSDLLDEILLKDQGGRKEFRAALNEYGYESEEAKKIGRQVYLSDSMNVITITNLLDNQGWPELNKIGRSGSNAIFLTLQHSNLETQEKYLPVLTQAVADEKIAPGALALFEDRLRLGQGKKQVYGSQVNRDRETGQNYVQPLMEPEKVNERRAEVGLGPIEDYLKTKGIDWDVEKHKALMKKMEAEKAESN